MCRAVLLQVPEPGLFHWLGTDGDLHEWQNPARRGEVALTRLENIFGNWIDLEAQAVGESSPLVESQFRVRSWKTGPLRPPGTLRRFYHQVCAVPASPQGFVVRTVHLRHCTSALSVE